MRSSEGNFRFNLHLKDITLETLELFAGTKHGNGGNGGNDLQLVPSSSGVPVGVSENGHGGGIQGDNDSMPKNRGSISEEKSCLRSS